ncbi:4'-phosphopantetheinyl transferase superfamily protein [Streptomyces syringium]|uniref:4'-phosphopantetheinyl transferase superfamily protein n=1 Tax=Streptomyces syringium TaxID=76729 RepID=UPI003456C3EF
MSEVVSGAVPGAPEPVGPDTAVVVRLTPSRERRPDSAPLVREAAADALRVPPGEIRIGREPGGRPRLGGAAEGLHVSVSHCAGAVAVALSRLGPVGVDVERLRPLPAVALGRRWFSAAEARWLADRAAEEQPAAFLWLWTHKEAIGKVRGLGLSEGGLRRPVPYPSGLSWSDGLSWPDGLAQPDGLPHPDGPARTDGPPWTDAGPWAASPRLARPVLAPVPGEPGMSTAAPRVPGGYLLAVAAAGPAAPGAPVVVTGPGPSP